MTGSPNNQVQQTALLVGGAVCAIFWRILLTIAASGID